MWLGQKSSAPSDVTFRASSAYILARSCMKAYSAGA